ncbi:MAG: hypothetical protein HYV13_04005 [Candidatus Doudnabacteria bacterium]|nr:hypothetical protein [Candidatus Doudnabacteria bacterium]
MNEEMRNLEEEKQFIATTYIDLTRHGSRFGGPMDITFADGSRQKFDDPTDLTPVGKSRAKEYGAANYPEEVTLVHPRGGDEPRHGETGEDILAGSEKFGEREDASPVKGKTGKVKGARRGKGVDYAGAGLNPVLKQYKDLINTKLNRLVLELSPEDQERFKSDAEFRAANREKAQIVGLREALANEDIARPLAENEANELMHAIELSRRGVKGGESKAIPIVGSGLFAESLYKQALVVEDPQTGERKVGFDDVDEIGGFTKQATAFRIKLSRDTRMGDPRSLDDFDKDTKAEFEFTDPERAKLFKGKRVYLDWQKVRELAEVAKSRFEKKE